MSSRSMRNLVVSIALTLLVIFGYLLQWYAIKLHKTLAHYPYHSASNDISNDKFKPVGELTLGPVEKNEVKLFTNSMETSVIESAITIVTNATEKLVTNVPIKDETISTTKNVTNSTLNAAPSSNVEPDVSITEKYTSQRQISQENNQASTSNLMAFEPYVLEDIQTVPGDQIPRIPHIIHLIFVTYVQGKGDIPAIYKNTVMSYVRFNPKWTFYFWTLSTGRILIEKRYPEYLPTWDSYDTVIKKADALRYFVLYEFGGVYTDLDMICKRSLDRPSFKYACILTPEAFEHSAILYSLPYVLNNGFMMCRPKHPFMKHLFSNLQHFTHYSAAVSATGPFYLTKQFDSYNNIRSQDLYKHKLFNESNSPYFYKGTLKEDGVDAVYVANTVYFMHSFDAGQNFGQYCIRALSQIELRGCFLWKRRSRNKTESPFSYTDHLWKHIYSFKATEKMILLNSLIPKKNLKVWQPGNRTKTPT